jgi:hypothetical protein
MKKIYSSLLILSISFSVSAQVTITDAYTDLDTNQIRARIYSGGTPFWSHVDTIHGFEYPKNSGLNPIFASSIWVGGYSQNNLYLAGSRYNATGRDYFPGPVMDASAYSAQLPIWNKVWKIKSTEIIDFITNWNTPGYVIPQSILDWPAHGNTAVGQSHNLAPYYDNNGNNWYEPTLGDYPIMRGDEAAYFIFNDSMYAHGETGGLPMGIEIHGMAYEYGGKPLLAKMVFVNFLIYNRSPRTYDSLFLGAFTDIDLGYAFDDYIGCDTNLETYYGYNGDSIDLSYGVNSPAVAVIMLNYPMVDFNYFNNLGWAPMTDPNTAAEYYMYMNSYWKDSTHMVLGGNGHEDFCITPCTPINYMFPGYPGDTNQWNEVSAGNSPGDRRGVGTTGPFTLNPGDYISLDIAYAVVDSGYTPKSCGFSNVDNLLAIVPLIKDYFNTNHPQNGIDLALGNEESSNVNANSLLQIFPNPAHDNITINIESNMQGVVIEIHDILGRMILSSHSNEKQTSLNISGLKNGIYIIKVITSDYSVTTKFIKQ